MPVGFSLPRGYHARSISLPAPPSPLRIHHDHLIEKNVKNIEDMRAGFAVLINLYKYVIELLNMPLTQHVFTHHRRDPWVEDWLEESVIFIDECSSTRESVLLLQMSLRQIQSVLKRWMTLEKQEKPLLSHELDLVVACICSLKKLKKETNKSALKMISSSTSNAPAWASLASSGVEGRHLVEVVRMLKEASVATGSVFQSTQKSLFGSHASAHQKGRSRWALVSKVLVKDAGSEVEEVNVVINTCLMVLQRLLMRRSERDMNEDEVAIRGLCERLEDLERGLQGVEKEMESLFRCLIRTRVSFLNVLSH